MAISSFFLTHFNSQCVGEGTILLIAKNQYIQQANADCQRLTTALKGCDEQSNWLLDAVPSYNTVTIHFNSLVVDHHYVLQWLTGIKTQSNDVETTHRLTLPVCYTLDKDNDLASVTEQTSLSVAEIVKLHTQQVYQVYAIGFVPGFAYLGFVDKKLRLPRKTSPRLKVAKGAVAIADQQLAVYPNESPGGWNIIGYCPVDLLTLNRPIISPFSVGMQVQFTEINEQQYAALEGKTWEQFNVRSH